MKASDLRIGNYVQDYGQLTEVYPFLLSRLYEINESGKTCINVEPIPLTKEWLLRFGFSKSGDTLFTKNIQGFNFVIDLISENKIRLDCPFGKIYGEYKEPEYYYVHQLQNLYFALTGEELTLNK